MNGQRQRRYRLHVSRQKADEWFWELQASNGTPMASSSTLHTSKRNALQAADRVISVLREGFCTTVVE